MRCSAALISFCLLGAALSCAAQDAVLVLSPGPVLSTIAGTRKNGFAGDGKTAIAATLSHPSAIVYDAAVNLYFADTQNHRIRRIDGNGAVATVAGTGVQGYSGDGGSAVQAQLDSPAGLCLSTDGSLLIADTRNHRIRRVGSDGSIQTVAGSGLAGFTGDGGSAAAARLRLPQAVAVDGAGVIYIADTANHRIRKIDASGTISTVAGSGVESGTGDGGPALQAGLDAPSGLALQADGTLLIADRLNSRIRVLAPDGTISSLPQLTGVLRHAAGVSTNATGDTLVADTGNYQIRQISADGAGVTLGSGEQGVFDPTSANPYATTLGKPVATSVDAVGGFAIADPGNAQIQHVALPALTFADTIIGGQSVSKTLLLQNVGNAALRVESIAVSSGFVLLPGSSCGTVPFALAAVASCSLQLQFAPSVAGTQSGVLRIAVENAAPQGARLTGNGLRTGTALASSTVLQASGTIVYAGSPLTLNASVIVGSTLAPTGTIAFLDGTTAIGTASLVNGTAQLVTKVLTAGQHTLFAMYSGDGVYAGSNSAAIPQTVVAPPDFSFAAGSSQVMVQSGNAGTMALTLQPINGTLNRTVSITVSGLPTSTTVNIVPVPITLASDPVTITLAFKLPASLSQRNSFFPGELCCLLLFGGVAAWKRTGRAALVLTALVLCFAMQGCGGGYLGSGTASATARNYTVSVTATTAGVTGDPLVHTATFTLVVS